MSLRERIIDYSKGDNLGFFWNLFYLRERTKNKFLSDILTFKLYRMARKHGGYIGREAVIEGIPVLPHGIHGIYISRYARIEKDCRIYQNVTIGEVDGKAPHIGRGCVIGAGAEIVGGITIGDNVKIGAGAVVSKDVPNDCTVVAQPIRIIRKGLVENEY